MRGSELEVVLQADGEARVLGDAADALEHARHEADAVERVVSHGEGFALGAEEDLLMRNEAALAHGMHADPVDVGAAGTTGVVARRVRHLSEPRVRAGLGNEAGRARRRARRGVDLGRVMQLDDLDRLVSGPPGARSSS